GKSVYYLNIGQPDIETPVEFFVIVKKYKNKVLNYAPSEGLKTLITSIRDYYINRNVILEEKNIIVTSGASEAILFAISVVCNPNDEILIPEPFYVNTVNFIDQLSVKVVPIPTR